MSLTWDHLKKESSRWKEELMQKPKGEMRLACLSTMGKDIENKDSEAEAEERGKNRAM